MPGSTSFAASTLLSAAAGPAVAGSRENDKSINTKEFLLLLQDLGLLDGSISIREAVKVSSVDTPLCFSRGHNNE